MAGGQDRKLSHGEENASGAEAESGGEWRKRMLPNALLIGWAIQAIPSSSPVCGGFVQHEYKRGKWQKRYIELREHSLWLSKKDNVRSFSR